METSDRDLAENRLTGLERRVRRLQLAVVALAGLPFLLAVAGTDAGDPARLAVRDAKGVVRIELATLPDGDPVLRLVGRAGEESLVLRGSEIGPVLQMSDGKDGSLSLSALSTGASLVIGKRSGEIQASMSGAGHPTIRLQNDQGELVWNAP